MQNIHTTIHNFGLLVIRVGLGIVMIIHGVPHLLGGSSTWFGLGQSMAFLGITICPAIWGFAAACTETIGAALLVVGFHARIMSALLAFTMLVATIMHIQKGDAFQVYSHALSLFVIFVGLTCTGAGSLSCDTQKN